jgi:uncharacterized protein YjbJ (UPF0337 family)
MVVAYSKVVEAEATRAANYSPDAQSPRGTGQSGSILKEEDAMKSSTKDQAKGKLHEVKGKIKEKVGKATNNPDLENEGTKEKTDGKVQKKIGQVEKVLGD